LLRRIPGTRLVTPGASLHPDYTRRKGLEKSTGVRRLTRWISTIKIKIISPRTQVQDRRDMGKNAVNG
jgi:hypothetical protein